LKQPINKITKTLQMGHISLLVSFLRTKIGGSFLRVHVAL